MNLLKYTIPICLKCLFSVWHKGSENGCRLGTFFSALVYFRKDILQILSTKPKLQITQFTRMNEKQKILTFLVIATVISGFLGFLLLKTLEVYESQILAGGRIITAVIGIFLLVTGYLQLSIKRTGLRTESSLTFSDSVLLGIVQGCAVLPGLSRSGVTVAALLFKKFQDTSALKLSFLLSLPIVLLGNIILNFDEFTFSAPKFVGLATAFASGLLSIHVLLKIAQKINFGKFVIAFGLITILAAIIG